MKTKNLITARQKSFETARFLFMQINNLEKANTQKMIAKMGFVFCTTYSLFAQFLIKISHLKISIQKTLGLQWRTQDLISEREEAYPLPDS